jgi:hypothetical protein
MLIVSMGKTCTGCQDSMPMNFMYDKLQDKAFTLLTCNVTSCGSWLLFQDNILFPSSRAEQSKNFLYSSIDLMSLQDGTNMLSKTVVTNYQAMLHNIPE